MNGTGWRNTARGFVRSQPLAACSLLALLLLAVAMAWPQAWTRHGPLGIDIFHRHAPPGATHLLGTDAFGRDVLARLLHGARSTLQIGLGVVALAFVSGTACGTLAGYVGGWVDNAMMRFVDALMAFPSLVLAIALSAAFGPSLGHAMLAVAIVLAPQFARLARAQAVGISAQLYVTAAVAIGVPHHRILLHYVLRNGIGPLLVQASLAVGGAILQTASLGFLGLGAQPPLPEWGSDLASSLAYADEAPWVALAPGLAIFLTVMACNLVGDALAAWFDPRQRAAR